MPVAILLLEELGVKVLEFVTTNWDVVWVAGVVVVLGPELPLVKILTALLGQCGSIKAKPLTILALLTWPQELTCAVPPCPPRGALVSRKSLPHQ